MRSHHKSEENEGDQYGSGSHQIGRGERKMLRQHTSRKDSDTKAQVPGSQISGSCCTTLCISTEIDEKSVERREGGAEPQTATKGDQQESHGSAGRTKGHSAVDGKEIQVSSLI